MKIDKLEIGTVSHGTLRPEDLAPAFYLYATDMGVPDVFDWNDDVEAIRDGTYTGDPSEVIDGLIDAITADLPEFLHFGAHEGDGSDYGVWGEADYDEKLVDALLAVAKAAEGDSNDAHIDALQEALELALEQISWG